MSFVPALHAAPPEAEAAPAPAGPGAPMRVLPYDPAAPFGPDLTVKEATGLDLPTFAFTTVCSQGPVGEVRLPDGTTQRVMLTAGHCVTGDTESGILLGDTVYAPTRGGYTRIGTIDLVHFEGQQHAPLQDALGLALKSVDWGIVVLDSATLVDGSASSLDNTNHNRSQPVPLTGVRDYRTLRPGEIAWDNFGQPICKDGSASARTCGRQVFYTADNVWHVNLNYKSGDSGGINYDPSTGQIIGMTSLGVGPVGSAQRADRALEIGYDIPDGQVNDYFTPAAPAERADFLSVAEEEAEMNRYTLEHNPGLTPDDLRKPTGRELFDQTVAATQADAAAISYEAQAFAVGATAAVATGQASLPQVAADASEFAGAVNDYAAERAAVFGDVLTYWAFEELGWQ